MPEVLKAVIDSTVEDILIETQHTLAYSRIRERYDYTDEDVADFLNRIRVAANLVTELPQVTVVTRDPNDDMVIATAVCAQAAYIVTRDKDLLSLQQYEDITVISPEAFMAIIRELGRLSP
jgi:putative PIN family toxin of toxin-antitoxin system